jgi:Endonuclease-reverse transcriptase
MAVCFKGDNGFLSVFNIYNEITNNDTLKSLDNFYDLNKRLIRPMNMDCVVWLGDFNRHHPIWEDNKNEHLFEPNDYIALLINLLYKHDMLLALPKGKPTLQMLAGNWTRPDNVWWCNTRTTPSSVATQSPPFDPP